MSNQSLGRRGPISGGEPWQVMKSIDGSEWWVTEGGWRPGEPERIKAKCPTEATAKVIAMAANNQRPIR